MKDPTASAKHIAKLSRGKSSPAALTTADAQVRAAMRLRITLSKENAKNGHGRTQVNTSPTPSY